MTCKKIMFQHCDTGAIFYKMYLSVYGARNISVSCQSVNDLVLVIVFCSSEIQA